METCEQCQHVEIVQQSDGNMPPTMECHYMPPQAFLIPVPSPVAGGDMRLMKQSAFPNCLARCGMFAERSTFVPLGPN